MFIAIIRAALRGVRKEPAYLAVRVGGLAVGIATACLTLAFVRWELGFDRSFTDSDRIYRIVSERTAELPAAVARVWPNPTASSSVTS